MDIELLNKISNLSFYGYYDPSGNKVVVHFFNKEVSKPDVIAFLKRDMSWDVREIVSETSVLNDSGEIITVVHKQICNQLKNSDFDKYVRAGLISMAKETYGKDAKLEEKAKIFDILNDGYKDDN